MIKTVQTDMMQKLETGSSNSLTVKKKERNCDDFPQQSELPSTQKTPGAFAKRIRLQSRSK
jgi:hypothetical protein